VTRHEGRALHDPQNRRSLQEVQQHGHSLIRHVERPKNPSLHEALDQIKQITEGMEELSLPLNQIVLGDCVEVMKDWPENSIDCVVTDPP